MDIDQNPHITHVTYSPTGGAGVAASRLVAACQSSGVNASILISDATGDAKYQTVTKSKSQLLPVLTKEFSRFQRKRDGRPDLLSLGATSSGLARHLNAQSNHITHLHWINNDMMSIREIGQLRHPVVWTLHDMWPFAGAAHYSEDAGWQHGYNHPNNRPLDRHIWKKKKRHWIKPMQIVSPSNWLAQCVRVSQLMADWPVTVIPNAIDTKVWRPMAQSCARAALGIDPTAKVIAFGAMGGDSDPRKGFEHLNAALRLLHDRGLSPHLLIFGAEGDESQFPFVTRYTGVLSDPEDLRAVYSAADVFALPSRQDNLPNTGVESLACGTPIVGFNIGGLPDFVANNDVGALAKPFDPRDLAAALINVLDRQRHNNDGKTPTAMGMAARNHAVASYGADVVGDKHKALYDTITQNRPR
jgi:glycosyltransferase involved in cell wall biosynthesis